MRTISHINAELDAEGFRHNRPITSPWPDFANDPATRQEEAAHRLESEITQAVKRLRTYRAVKDWLDGILFDCGLMVVRRRGREFCASGNWRQWSELETRHLKGDTP